VGILLVICGCLVIAIGMFRSNFCSADFLTAAAYGHKSRAMPGQLISIVIGLLFVAFGVRALFLGG
jgi:hypothetical protein